MRLTIPRNDLLRLLTSVNKVIESRNTIPILSNVLLSADGGRLSVKATDLDIEASASIAVQPDADGKTTVDARMLADIVKKLPATADVLLDQKDNTLHVTSGRSKFKLATLPAGDFPSFSAGNYTTEFDVDLAALLAPVKFAISTEETRYYLNGTYLHVVAGKLTAVATDGHRLSRNVGAACDEFTGVIIPRKMVDNMPIGVVHVELSDTKIRISTADATFVSKLIDGTFPDYQRIIPTGNDKIVTVDRGTFMAAADRVATISSERGRAVRVSIASGQAVLSVTNNDGQAATEEVAVDYDGEPVDIVFNARYVADVFAQFPAGDVKLALLDGGAPALITGAAEGLLCVMMPMRV